ncbi:MAG: ribosome small subunit-dependent GTPase A [Clostridia bacterium]|nr:ribosome small subunit-dependent GTPase A [Clostridia bacterium]
MRNNYREKTTIEIELFTWGLDLLTAEAAKGESGRLCRVIARNKGAYDLTDGQREFSGRLSGKMLYGIESAEEYPTVGDYVIYENGVIQKIIARHSVFMRKVAGTRRDAQLIAANIDVIFICVSLERESSQAAIERYLAAAYESGAKPVVVFTKGDLMANAKDKAVQLGGRVQTDAVAVSVKDGDIAAVTELIGRGVTAAFVGASGVGKSSLVNAVTGANALKTGQTRSDGKGRHVSTRSELFCVPSGGVVIDTAGMREFGLIDIDTENAFSDIEELAKRCKYADCRHENEPFCAVKEAVERGELSKERYRSYIKLCAEAQKRRKPR